MLVNDITGPKNRDIMLCCQGVFFLMFFCYSPVATTSRHLPGSHCSMMAHRVLIFLQSNLDQYIFLSNHLTAAFGKLQTLLMETLCAEINKTTNEYNLPLITLIVFSGNYSFAKYEKQICLCTQHTVILE